MSQAGNSSLDQFGAPTKRRRVDQDYAAFVAPSTSRTAAKAKAATAEAAARTAQLKKDDAVPSQLVRSPLPVLAPLALTVLSRAARPRHARKSVCLPWRASLPTVLDLPLADCTLSQGRLQRRRSSARSSEPPDRPPGPRDPGRTRTRTRTRADGVALAAQPPASLQRYLSRYNLLEPSSLSYHHAVHPVPPLPATLIPPLTGRLLNKTRSKPPHTLRSYRDDEELPLRAAEVDGSVLVATTSGTKPTAGAPAKKRVWQEPKTQEFADLSAYDDPQLVVERLAMRAKAHWDKKDSVKEGCVAVVCRA